MALYGAWSSRSRKPRTHEERLAALRRMFDGMKDEPDVEPEPSVTWATPCVHVPEHVAEMLQTLAVEVEISVGLDDQRVLVGRVVHVSRAWFALRLLGTGSNRRIMHRHVVEIGVLGRHGWRDRRHVAQRQMNGEWIRRSELPGRVRHGFGRET
jgi:hypothetical protein